MDRQNIIVLTKDGKTEAWGSLTEICKNHKDFRYFSVKSKKFPFNYKGWLFTKVPFRTKA